VGKILPRPGIAPPFSNKATATIYIFKKICMHSMYVYKVWANKYNEWMNKRELHKLTHLPKVIKLAPKCLLLLIIDLHILEGNLNSLESLNPYVLVSYQGSWMNMVMNQSTLKLLSPYLFTVYKSLRSFLLIYQFIFKNKISLTYGRFKQNWKEIRFTQANTKIDIQLKNLRTFFTESMKRL